MVCRSCRTALDALQDGAGQLYQGQRRFADEGMQKLKEMLDLTVEELDTLQTILDETKALNKEYSSYAGCSGRSGNNCSLFIQGVDNTAEKRIKFHHK